MSLTHPDVYVFVGGSVISLYGTGALAFKDQVPTPQEIRDSTDTSPNTIFGTLQLGLTLRLKNRIGATFYLESAPNLDNSPAVGNFLDLGLKVHTLGFEVQFCF